MSGFDETYKILFLLKANYTYQKWKGVIKRGYLLRAKK